MFDWLFGNGDTEHKQAQREMNALNEYQGTADILSKALNAKFSNMGSDDPNHGLIGAYADSYDNILNQIGGRQDELKKTLGRTQNDYFGGLLGTFINPITQTIGAGKDLLTGQYAANNRDPMSDLGALGSTATMFMPVGGAIKNGAKMFGSVGANAGVGAGFSLADALRESGTDKSCTHTSSIYIGSVNIIGISIPFCLHITIPHP